MTSRIGASWESMPSRKEYYFDPYPSSQARACEIQGCLHAGEYRAPKSRQELNDYRWYCLEHVREINKAWNYFDGMSPAEIETYMKEAVTGHRPTWKPEELNAAYAERYQALLQEELKKFFYSTRQQQQPGKPKPKSAYEKSLATLGFDAPCTERELKLRYRALVKEYHPDLHQGDRVKEERFKQITAAYSLLVQHFHDS